MATARFADAGAIATIADRACGCGRLHAHAAGAAVLTIEYRINLLAPTAGERFVADGTVIRSGRTITTCRADVTAEDGDRGTPVATMLATLMSIEGRTDPKGEL